MSVVSYLVRQCRRERVVSEQQALGQLKTKRTIYWIITDLFDGLIGSKPMDHLWSDRIKDDRPLSLWNRPSFLLLKQHVVVG